ncbi:MAG TPA: endo alpha-1,4 polygalactosaminidase, partial [Candidatus Dormibacteraeota bacterium]|nr:endo alpha-1,4 polygalactosaminidase [Candidatus Dormibacteraeota bacterium]
MNCLYPLPMLRLWHTLSFCLFFAPLPLHARDWSLVTNWVYQLTNYKDNRLAEIANSGFNLAVIDLARDGATDFFTHEELDSVKHTGAFVLSYFEIGAIEEYRPEWKTTPQDLKLAKVKGWPKERLVRFWDDRWWPIIQDRIDQALNVGFDGAYLDMVTAYEEIPAKEFKREELANKMVELISRI